MTIPLISVLGTGKALILNDEGYHQVEVRSHTESTIQAGAGITLVSGSELNDYLTNTNSGSGSGLPLLVQRSVARQVCFYNKPLHINCNSQTEIRITII